MNSHTLPPSSVDDGATVTGMPFDAAAQPTLYSSDAPPPGFAIEAELGRGGMGVVYLARQHGLNRLVALKMMLGTDPKGVIRFLAESEAVAAVRHPNVVEVYQYGEADGRPFLVLEYCPGGGLDRSTPTAPLADPAAVRAAVTVLAAVADGVNAAHAAGIVHRDLKPHNVLLAADGTPKVTDFGLAKQGDTGHLTRTNAVMGTPAYMPPEQARGDTKFVGPTADVWALGVMLYERVCGRRPFAGDDPWQLLAAVQRGDFPRPRALNPALPRDVELICLKCLALDPAGRYTTAGELATDLRHWLGGQPISARPPGPVESAVKWVRRNKAISVGAATTALALAAGTAVSVWQMVRADRERDAAVAARDGLATATDSLRTTAARGILRTIQPSGDVVGLTEPEFGALNELAQADNPLRFRVVEQAARDPVAARGLALRGEPFLHAVVGLDVDRKARVATMLADAAEAVTGPPHACHLATILAKVRLDEGTDRRAVAVLLKRFRELSDVKDLLDAADALARLADRMTPDEALAASDLLVWAMSEPRPQSDNNGGSVGGWWLRRNHHAERLARVAKFAPPDRREKAVGQAVQLLIETLTDDNGFFERELAKLAPLLTDAQVRRVIADVSLFTPKGTSQQRRVWAYTVEALASRLPVGECLTQATWLSTYAVTTADGGYIRIYLTSLLAVLKRINELYDPVQFPNTRDSVAGSGLQAIFQQAEKLTEQDLDGVGSPLQQLVALRNPDRRPAALEKVAGVITADRRPYVVHTLGTRYVAVRHLVAPPQRVAADQSVARHLAAVARIANWDNSQGAALCETLAALLGECPDPRLAAEAFTAIRERAEELVKGKNPLARQVEDAVGRMRCQYLLEAATPLLPHCDPEFVKAEWQKFLPAVDGWPELLDSVEYLRFLAVVHKTQPAAVRHKGARQVVEHWLGRYEKNDSDPDLPTAIGRYLALHASADLLPADEASRFHLRIARLFARRVLAMPPQRDDHRAAVHTLAGFVSRLAPADRDVVRQELQTHRGGFDLRFLLATEGLIDLDPATVEELATQAAKGAFVAVWAKDPTGKLDAGDVGDHGEPWLRACLTRESVRRQELRGGLPAAVGGIPPAPLPPPLPVPRLVELLAHPNCVGQVRGLVLGELSRHFDRPFADLWEFVRFAQERGIPLSPAGR